MVPEVRTRSVSFRSVTAVTTIEGAFSAGFAAGASSAKAGAAIRIAAVASSQFALDVFVVMSVLNPLPMHLLVHSRDLHFCPVRRNATDRNTLICKSNNV